MGDYHSLGRQWPGFMAAHRALRTAGSQYLVRSFHDPAITRAGRRLADLGSYDLYRRMDGPEYVEMDICLPLRV